MKKFITRFVLFLVFISLMGEIIIRVYRLVSDIPQRYVDNTGIQRYIPGQSGYYKKAREKWEVNEYGWLGTSKTDRDSLISIVGDSYIENLMNPLACNQGSLLNVAFKNIGFFEAGRSGVTFIEAMEITNLLDSTIHPDLHLVYVSSDGFQESISNEHRYTNRMQIDVVTGTLLKGTLKAPMAKRILYNWKLLYYLYVRFPLFVSARDQNKPIEPTQKNGPLVKMDNLERLFRYCRAHYKVEKIILVFHPGSDKTIVALAQQHGFKVLLLNSDDDERTWAVNESDEHWSCYGHQQVAKQTRDYLIRHLND